MLYRDDTANKPNPHRLAGIDGRKPRRRRVQNWQPISPERLAVPPSLVANTTDVLEATDELDNVFPRSDCDRIRKREASPMKPRCFVLTPVAKNPTLMVHSAAAFCEIRQREDLPSTKTNRARGTVLLRQNELHVKLNEQ
jgi:hypothetical protein